MLPPDEAKAGKEAEIIAAERALANGQLLIARRHLADAQRLGALPNETQMLERTIEEREQWARKDGKATGKQAKGAVWAGAGVAILGYLVLSIQQPPDWTPVVWAVLAFGLVPVLCGLTTGALIGANNESQTRFWAGFRAAFIAMSGYAGVSLMILRTRIGSGGDSGQIFLVGLFVTVMYSLISGIVSGLCSAKLTKGRSR